MDIDARSCRLRYELIDSVFPTSCRLFPQRRPLYDPSPVMSLRMPSSSHLRGCALKRSLRPVASGRTTRCGCGFSTRITGLPHLPTTADTH